MKQLCLALVLSASSLVLSAQKVSIKENIISIEKEKFAYLEEKGCENRAEFCAYIFYDVNKEEYLIAANLFTYHQPATHENPQGNAPFYYLNLTFNGFEHTAEIDFPNFDIQNVALLFKKEQLIEKGALNKEKVQQFIKKHGTKYSNQNPNVLILKEDN